MVTENLHTKFQPIRTTELSVIAIYTQIASGQILIAVRSYASVVIFSKVQSTMFRSWGTLGLSIFIKIEGGRGFSWATSLGMTHMKYVVVGYLLPQIIS